MEFVRHLECVRCGRTYAPDPWRQTCEDCGIRGILDVVFDYDLLAARWDRSQVDRSTDPTLWRFLPLVPVDPATPRPPLRTGGTPLIPAPRLAEHLGLSRVWVKDEGNNPTGSLKDRASAVAVVKAQEAGARVVACASTGNAASSLAGHAASMGMQAVIFVPNYAAQGKVAQLLLYGATVLSVQASYTAAYDLNQEAVRRYGWYNRNCAVNPYLVEGKKTAGLEVAQQLGWQAPDWVAVSVGDGCTIAGIYKGFAELHRLGWIPRVPRMLGVQAAGARALYDYYHTGRWVAGGEDTIADGIAVGLPKNADKAVRALRESGGAMVLVSDDEIRAAQKLLAALTGVFGEPAAAAALAGLVRALDEAVVERGASVVVMVTGHGLKDIKNAIAAAGEPARIEPTLEAVVRAVPPELVGAPAPGAAQPRPGGEPQRR